MEQKKDKRIAYAEILNRCWEDAEFLKRFRSCPADILTEFGIETVPGADYHVVEQTRDHLYLAVPEETTEDQIHEFSEQLKENAEKQTGEPFRGELEVLRNTQKDIYLVCPPEPQSYELTDEMVDGISAGGSESVCIDTIFFIVGVVFLV